VNGPGSEIRRVILLCMVDVLPSEGICSSRSHRCEWKNDPDDSVYIMTFFSV
jgi:hypothetical protein